MKNRILSFIQYYSPKWQAWLIVLLLVTVFTRFYRLGDIHEYVFDEVYHAFTAKMYSLDRYEAWVWWETPPEGVAYEWTHPPLAKVIMSWGINMIGGPGEMPDKARDPNTLLSNSSLGWRFFSGLFGVIGTLAMFLLVSKLFKNKWIGLLAAAFFSFDLLPLVQSRTAMNDIFAVTFTMLAFYFFIHRKTSDHVQNSLLNYRLPLLYWLFAGLSIGCAIASKWTPFFALGFLIAYHFATIIYSTLVQIPHKKAFIKEFLPTFAFRVLQQGALLFVFFMALPFVIYLLSYSQLFTTNIANYQGNSLREHIEVKKWDGDVEGLNARLDSIKNNICVESGTPGYCNKNKVLSEISYAKNSKAFWTWLNSVNSHFADRFYIWWGVQQQMWWYHTNLKATHNYTSQWWTWPLNIRPVWFYVKYCNSPVDDTNPQCNASFEKYNTDKTIADIYTMGNPAIFWTIIPVFVFLIVVMMPQYRKWFLAIVPAAIILMIQLNMTQTRAPEVKSMSENFTSAATIVTPQLMLFSILLYLFFVLLTVWDTYFKPALHKNAESKQTKDRSELLPLVLCILMYAFLWLPWARSPRIMFFYHFFPPVTFFYPLLAYLVYRLYTSSRNGRALAIGYLLIVVISFAYFYPHVTGQLVPENQREQYFWLKSWK